MRFPIAVWVESWGGLAGGEMKRADCSRGCDGSQERADGSNIFDDAPSLVMGRSGWISFWEAAIAAATANNRAADSRDWFATGCDRVSQHDNNAHAPGATSVRGGQECRNCW